MIPKKAKFPMRTEFYAFRKYAKIVHSAHLVLYRQAVTQGQDHGRCGVVIPKKNAKLATTRSALRRILFDTLHKHSLSRQSDLVLFIKKKAPTQDLLLELERLMY